MRLAGRIFIGCLLSVTLAFAAPPHPDGSAGTSKIPAKNPPKVPVGQLIQWVDLEPSVQTWQDQLHTPSLELKSAPGVVVTATGMKPFGYIWVNAWVTNKGNLPSGPFRIHMQVKRAPGNASDNTLISSGNPHLLDQWYDCPGLAPGGKFTVGGNYPAALLENEATTKFWVCVTADPHDPPNTEYGQVKEKKGAQWYEFNNNYQYWYVIKKP